MPRSTINGTAIDLDGKEMILDADQDTTLTVDTDDRVDIKVAGSDKVHVTSTGLGVATNSPSTALHLKDSDGGILQTVETGDSGNAYIKFINSTTGSGAFSDGFLVGLDTDESATFWLYEADHMKFATSGTEAMRIDATGAVTKPLQPAFLVHASGSQNDMTAGSTATAVLSTEVYDQNNDFASNTFTAPVTGKYFLVFTALFTDVQTECTEIEIRINTSNRIYRLFILPSKQLSADGSIGDSFSVVADMDASDTAIIQVTPSGGSDEMNIHSYTFFSGCLLA